jgi:hypothetical protein
MADDDYVEGDSHSEPADAPGSVPSDDAPERGTKSGGFDSGSATSDAPTLHKPRAAARTAEARKAFAAAILADKDKPAPRAADNDILDPDEYVGQVGTAPIAAKADAAKAKADAAPPPAAVPTPAPAVAAPPAPSLDPEIRKLRDEVKREREQLAADRAELEKSRVAKPAEAAVTPPDLERYIDSPPAAYREWLEQMRGEKFATDDDFKSEVSDFITLLSSDVLGVPLPENVRVRLDAAQAKKIVRTHKTIQSRREQESAARAEKERIAATEKAEIERVETEWKRAAEVLSGHLRTEDPAKSYPWLAAEDDPGGVIVDVIRAQLNKDGTKLAWDEAAKVANEYLKTENERHYGKRKALFSGVAPAQPAAKPAAAAPVVPPQATKPVTSTTPSGNQKWSNDKHRENTKAAFRAQLSKTE